MCLNCHVVTMNIEINSLKALERACHRLGWEFKQGQKTYTWVGRWYDDSPVPRNLFASEAEYLRVVAMSRQERIQYMENMLGKCEHAIHIPGHTCEIGVVKLAIEVGDFSHLICIERESLDDRNRNCIFPIASKKG